MVKEIVESQPLTLAEVKNTLTKRGKKAELSYIQRVTFDHTVKFSSLQARSARTLVNKLVKKFEMEESLAIQIVDIVPTTTEELASFLARAPRTYTADEVTEILELLESAIPKEATKKKK
ncbi:MAG: RNA polymerase Rpb4 family protein [Candidatus Thorarchaeota archaeon]